MNEQQMTDLVDRVGESLTPDVAGLVAGGTARGRRRRRRRTAGSVLCGVAVIAAVGGLGYAFAPGESGVGTDGTQVATSPTTSSAPEARRQFGPDPGKMASVLGDLLTGDVTQRRAWHEQPAHPLGFQAGSVLLDGAQVTILLERLDPPVTGCGEQPPGASCDAVPGGHLAGGTREEPASGGGATGIFVSTASYLTDDGFAVTAMAWNAPGEKHVDPVSAEPVLTEAQLAELVQNPVWLEDQQ